MNGTNIDDDMKQRGLNAIDSLRHEMDKLRTRNAALEASAREKDDVIEKIAMDRNFHEGRRVKAEWELRDVCIQRSLFLFCWLCFFIPAVIQWILGILS